jgi:hypothetical protein
MKKDNGKLWIGFDFDGTLARKTHWTGKGQGEVGEPIMPMVNRVKQLLKDGKKVKIVSARVSSISSEKDRKEGERLIKEFCKKHFGQELEVTCEKDYLMTALFDDRAVQVFPDTGITVISILDSLIAEKEKKCIINSKKK